MKFPHIWPSLRRFLLLCVLPAGVMATLTVTVLPAAPTSAQVLQYVYDLRVPDGVDIDIDTNELVIQDELLPGQDTDMRIPLDISSGVEIYSCFQKEYYAVCDNCTANCSVIFPEEDDDDPENAYEREECERECGITFPDCNPEGCAYDLRVCRWGCHRNNRQDPEAKASCQAQCNVTYDVCREDCASETQQCHELCDEVFADGTTGVEACHTDCDTEGQKCLDPDCSEYYSCQLTCDESHEAGGPEHSACRTQCDVDHPECHEPGCEEYGVCQLSCGADHVVGTAEYDACQTTCDEQHPTCHEPDCVDSYGICKEVCYAQHEPGTEGELTCVDDCVSQHDTCIETPDPTSTTTTTTTGTAPTTGPTTGPTSTSSTGTAPSVSSTSTAPNVSSSSSGGSPRTVPSTSGSGSSSNGSSQSSSVNTDDPSFKGAAPVIPQRKKTACTPIPTLRAKDDLPRIDRIPFTGSIPQDLIDRYLAESQFSDIETGDLYYTAFATLAAQGVINGYDGNAMRPNEAVSRAELAKVLAHTLELTVYADCGTFFWDVADASWYEPYVNALVLNSLVEGYADGSFRPSDPITLAELLAILGRAVPELTDNATEPEAVRDGLTTRGIFPPEVQRNALDSIVTRAELVTILYRLATVLDNDATAYHDLILLSAPSVGLTDIPLQRSLLSDEASWLRPTLEGGAFYADARPGVEAVIAFGHASFDESDSPALRLFQVVVESLAVGEQFFLTTGEDTISYTINSREEVAETDVAALADAAASTEFLFFACDRDDDYRVVFTATRD